MNSIASKMQVEVRQKHFTHPARHSVVHGSNMSVTKCSPETVSLRRFRFQNDLHLFLFLFMYFHLL